MAASSSLALANRRALMAENTDPRAVQTRAKLVTALRSLVADPEAAIPSVSAIASQAGVARSAFYSHFTGVDDLAEYALESDMRALAATDAPFRTDPSIGSSQATRRAVRLMIQALLDQRELSSWLFLRSGDGMLQRVRDVIAATVRTNLDATGLGRDIPAAHIEASAAYGAGGFVNTMTAYLRGDIDATPDELADLIVDLSPPLYRDH